MNGAIKYGRQTGTVIMAALFTDSKLKEGLGDILYAFEQCVLKICNEAVRG